MTTLKYPPADHLVLRRFAGLTPYNALDRIALRRDAARPWKRPPWLGYLHYGPITWQVMFQALSVFRGRAYHRGDATRRQHRGW